MRIIDNKICLRKADLSDISSLYKIKNDMEAASLLGGFSIGYSKKDIEDWINTHSNATNEVLFLIELIDSGEIIGHVGLYNIDYRVRKAEFAILISGKENQGKGYGSLCTKYMIDYAFNELNLKKISLSLLSDNERAYDLYKKHGFVQEGRLVKDQFKNGKYHDVILMALLNYENRN